MSELHKKLAWLRKRLHDGVNNRLRTVAGRRFASYCRPTAIQLLLTELCNARCVHCDIWKNSGPEESPTPEQWAETLSEFRRWLGPVQVTLTGGEALLQPFTIDLVEHGSRIGLFIELLIHGYWKDQTKIEQLALANPWRVTISFDGIGKTHDRVRGREGFFDRTNETNPNTAASPTGATPGLQDTTENGSHVAQPGIARRDCQIRNTRRHGCALSADRAEL